MKTEAKSHMLPSYVRYARLGFVFVAWLFAACVILQVFLAGVAVFVNTGDWSLHTSFVRMFALLPIILFALSFAGKLPLKLRLQSAWLFILIIAQFLTAVFSANIGFASALHPVIGVGMFVGALFIAQQAGAVVREEP